MRHVQSLTDKDKAVGGFLPYNFMKCVKNIIVKFFSPFQQAHLCCHLALKAKVDDTSFSRCRHLALLQTRPGWGHMFACCLVVCGGAIWSLLVKVMHYIHSVIQAHL